MLRDLFDRLPEICIYFKDTQSRYLLNNKAHLDLLGLRTPEEAFGKSDFDIFPEDMARNYYNDEQYIIQTGKSLIDREEAAVDKTTGKLKWLLSTKVPYYDATGKIIGIMGLSRNITRIKSLEEALIRKNTMLHRLSLRDALTGTYNRLYLERDFPALLSAFARTKQPLSVMILDLDNFKKINDELGHLTGDMVLRQSVSILRQVFKRKSDIIVRYGGDEFLVILFNNKAHKKDVKSPARSAEELARDVLEKLGRAEIRAQCNKKPMYIRASIGIAERKDDEDFKDLLVRADKALYEAKAKGRHRYILH
jgi:diguanylate cyclase (GGDEF)-like protein/PAS domain S-box-containing protein